MSTGYDDFFRAAKAVRKKSSTKSNGTKVSINHDFLGELPTSPGEKKRKSPLGWAFASRALIVSLIVAGCAGMVFSPESLDFLLDHVSLRVGPQALAKAAEGKNIPDANKATAESAASEKTAVSRASEKESPEVSEDLNYFSKLNETKIALDQREKELNELEEELHRQRKELAREVQKLEGIRNQIATVLKERVELDQEKVNKLVEVYTNMKPKQAAEVIGSINEDLAIDVLLKMKKKTAADILNLLEPKKAKSLSEQFAGYKREI